jgi:hypothetical protein
MEAIDTVGEKSRLTQLSYIIHKHGGGRCLSLALGPCPLPLLYPNDISPTFKRRRMQIVAAVSTELPISLPL